ncbi:MAG TPA: hypothetical protein VMF31_14155 [Solirubrobacterales bacterium]|nr:hypothetical protein [Solirubrobacterales bacterium]
MPTSANHGIVTPEPSDLATIPTHLKAMADQIDSELDAIAPHQITGVGAGKLLIANASGVVTPRTVTGDATISDTGGLKIGGSKVDTAELKDSAVTTVKLENGAVTTPKIVDRSVSLVKTKMRAGTVTIGSTPNGTFGTADFEHGIGHTNYFALISLDGGMIFRIGWGKGKFYDPHGDTDPENMMSVYGFNSSGSTVPAQKVSILIIDPT